MSRKLTWMMFSMFAVTTLMGCSDAMDDGGADRNQDGVPIGDFESGKADFGQRAKLIDGIALDSTVEGEFDPRVRTYGYTFEVKRGASLSIDLEAAAGDDARRLEEGETLDTVMAVYRGYEGPDEVGERIHKSDDGDDSVGAPTIEFEAEETATFFVAFTSYDDTGTGEYSLSLECAGTDLQCRRPNFDKPCEEGELYVQGGQIDSDTTWSDCTVVLMEPTTVAEDAILTIEPGVTVKGNYLQGANGDFGRVGLQVEGALQAVGTKENPIAFTAFKEDRGWAGIELNSPGNSLKHVFLDRAHTAVSFDDEAAGEVRHAVIEGGIPRENGERIQSQYGIQTAAETSAEFTHAVVKGFQFGVRSQNTRKLVVQDSVIRDNEVGINVRGRNETTRCNRDNDVDEYNDPIFDHVDILNNEREGLRMEGSNIFVQVTKSNIINNGDEGIELRGSGLSGDSHLSQNNIYGNNGSTEDDVNQQVLTYHSNNTIAMEDNYWQFISDPQLANTRNANCGGDISFTGFSPEPIADAGPRPAEIRQEVAQQTWKQTRQDG